MQNILPLSRLIDMLFEAAQQWLRYHTFELGLNLDRWLDEQDLIKARKHWYANTWLEFSVAEATISDTYHVLITPISDDPIDLSERLAFIGWAIHLAHASPESSLLRDYAQRDGRLSKTLDVLSAQGIEAAYPDWEQILLSWRPK